MEVMKNFKIQEVDPDELHKLFENPKDPVHMETIYVVTFR